MNGVERETVEHVIINRRTNDEENITIRRMQKLQMRSTPGLRTQFRMQPSV